MLPLPFRHKVHQPDPHEHQQARGDLEGGEVVEAHDQRDDHRDDGLDVGVHADDHRAEAFLADGDEEIGDEGGEDDHVGDLPENVHGHGRQVGRLECAETERQGHQG